MELIDAMNKLTIEHPEENSDIHFFKVIAADIDNVATEVALADFIDRILVVVTQRQKIGNLLWVKKDQVHGPLGSNDIYTTKVVFGAAGDEHEVAARYLAEALQITKPLCIFLSLKSFDIETVKACKDILLDIKTDVED